MFVRTKKIQGKEYAYLVSNRYNKRKKQSRQKSTRYVGKIIFIGITQNKIVAESINDSIILSLKELGFNENNNILTKDDISVDINSGKVSQQGKSVCLKLNEGYLCDYTLQRLLKFSPPNSTQRDIAHKFAEAFISSGIEIDQESFISLFSSKFKSLE